LPSLCHSHANEGSAGNFSYLIMQFPFSFSLSLRFILNATSSGALNPPRTPHPYKGKSSINTFLSHLSFPFSFLHSFLNSLCVSIYIFIVFSFHFHFTSTGALNPPRTPHPYRRTIHSFMFSAEIIILFITNQKFPSTYSFSSSL